MRILEINGVCGIRSTGRICIDIAEHFMSKGDEVKIAFGRANVPEKYKNIAVRISNKNQICINALKSRIFDNEGFNAKNATRKFLKWADEYNPDLLWLHNIHGYYINVEMLFEWIKSRPDMQVRWTLHDCWSFTGHCPHFEVARCDKWKNHCMNCSQRDRYPSSFFADNSEKNYDRKKSAFTGVNNMTIIAPSQWLADLVKQSFLKEYHVEVVYNTINKSVFKPTKSLFKEQYGIENKKLVLGVASSFNKMKGIEDFYKIAGVLNENYAVALVGLTKKQIRSMPNYIKSINGGEKKYICTYDSSKNDILQGNINGYKFQCEGYMDIIAIPRTNDQHELAALYTAADIFVNPTYEDTYPTVNLEAEACGTRVAAYNVGGVPETLSREDSVVVDVGNYEKLVEEIMK